MFIDSRTEFHYSSKQVYKMIISLKKSLKILKYIGFSFFFNLSEMDFFLCIPLAERLLESYELLNRPTSAAVAAHTDMFLSLSAQKGRLMHQGMYVR